MKKYVLAFVLLCSIKTHAQLIQTGFSSMTATPNATLSGKGEIGVVSSPFYKIAGLYQNPALISKGEQNFGINYTYMPWLTNLVSDIKFKSLTLYCAIDSMNAFGFNKTNFGMGSIYFTDNNAQFSQIMKPEEDYYQLTYTRNLKNGYSAGIGAKYIHSKDIYPGQNPINTFAIDLGVNYGKTYLINRTKLFLNLGAAINNFGPRIKYTKNDTSFKNFQSTNLKLGILINPEFILSNKFRLNFELANQFEKMLVPTPPIKEFSDITGKNEITKGKDDNISAFKALYQSFYDAPGGFKEEMHEILYKFGSEVRLNYIDKLFFAFRFGRFQEHETKGNRKYNTLGTGIGFFGFAVDYSRILKDNSAYNNSWALTISFRSSFNKVLRF